MDYKVQVSNVFEGPIAVLYELIRASKIDIYDIPMSEITERYLDYIKVLEGMDIEVTSEFILMAATLLFIKSRMLIPRKDKDDGTEHEDPRRELIDRLLEYQKFKNAATTLEQKETAQSDLIFKEGKQYILDYKDENNWVDISIYDLINAFSDIMEFVEEPSFTQLDAEELTTAMKINEIQDRLKTGSRFFFGELFSEKPRKLEVVVTFLAVLQLVKDRTIRIQQHRLFGDIRIVKYNEESANEQ